MTKAEFREKYKNIRKNINEDVVTEKSLKIFQKLENLDIIKNSKTFFVYLSYGREVATDELIDFLFKSGKTVLIPKCDVATETMIPVVHFSGEKLTDNFYGIKESESSEEYKGDIDVTIIPGIAFDIFGNRIGHGKGYYDKFLENKKTYRIGLCYSECLLHEEIPHNPNDMTMNLIITDREEVKNLS